MKKHIKAWSVSAGLAACLGVPSAWSQIQVERPDFSITFGAGWAIADSANLVLTKDDGVGGLAMLRSFQDAGTEPIDAAAQARILSDSLEGTLVVTKEETKTLGAYTVKVVHMSYDKLARMEREAEQRGRTATFRNGTLRAYYIRSQGVRVNILGFYSVAIVTPFASIEQAIPSLAIHAGTWIPGSFRRAAPAFTMAGGRLYFAGENPVAVSARDGRGRFVAWLRGVEGSDGAAWALPTGAIPLFLSAHFQGGRTASLGWSLGHR